MYVIIVIPIASVSLLGQKYSKKYFITLRKDKHLRLPLLGTLLTDSVNPVMDSATLQKVDKGQFNF